MSPKPPGMRLGGSRVLDEHHEPGEIRLVLRPDRSMGWRGNQRFFIAISLVSMGIATGFALLGAWLVLPFAGMEMAVLALALYWVSGRGLETEVISIRDTAVVISKGRWQVDRVRQIPRAWMQVRHEPAGHHWYPSHLYLRSHGVDTEIGSFLAEAEREALAGRLKQIMSGSAGDLVNDNRT